VSKLVGKQKRCYVTHATTEFARPCWSVS